MDEELKDYYFTFCQNSPLRNYYAVIRNKTYNEARKEMYRQFGNRWAFQYDSPETAGVEKFRLIRIEF